ncbi:MAG: hypothetical protein Q4G27_10525 [Flavobacteriaceae bacterium]|nr:hypothetical protein [Flavobacteriaceae bacterium]
MKEKDIHILEKIERYLTHQMTEEEKASFELELKEDTHLYQLYEEHAALINAVNTMGMKKSIAAFHSNISTPKKTETPSILKKHAWKWAAVILLLVTVGVGVFQQQKSSLFRTYYHSDPGLPTLMSSTSNAEFMEGMVYYKEKEYKDAKQNWLNLYAVDSKNDTLNYYLGMAEMNLNNYKKAALYLRNVNQASVFFSKARWYQALILIKQGRKSEAETILRSLNTPEAAELVQKIQS